MPKLKPVSLFLVLLFLFAGPLSIAVFARDITIQIDLKDEPDAAGYLVHYKAGDQKLPFDGTGAAEGSSPIDIGFSETATISGLDDDQIYYIGVTAYDPRGNESELSNVIATHWVPDSVFPDNDASLSPDRIEFAWGTPPKEIVSYSLVYSTDTYSLDDLYANRATNGAALLAGMSIIGLAGLGIRRKKMRWLLPLLLAFSVLWVHGCGGGGDSGDSAPHEVGTELTTSTEGVVTDIRTNTYTVNDLQPSTTYHWKVVAVDADGVEMESPVYSFTTE